MGRLKKQQSEISEIAEEMNDSFLANINHAMRTPLNALVGMIELMTKTGLDENQLKYARIMKESTDLLMMQLDNILDLAHMEAENFELDLATSRLEDIIKDALHPVISLAVKRQISMTAIYGPGVPETILTDSGKLQKVLTNLLSCSLKFADRGKIILNITKEQDGDEDKLRFSIENDQMLYDMDVTGSSKIKHFSTTDLREFGEIAVSLITARKLLVALGAEEGADNLDDHKLPFYFEMAIRKGKSEPDRSSFATLSGKRALILQSDREKVDTLHQSLKLWGVEYKVVTNVQSVNSQIRTAGKDGRPFDMVFFNELPPGKEIDRSGNDNMRLVLISSDFLSLSNSLHIEFSAYLCPPVHSNELLATLQSFYDDEKPYREAMLSDELSEQVASNELERIEARVLLVEDDFVTRMYAAEILESFGCRVAIAENGLHALTKLSSYSDYDIIFMDCMMPRLDGYKATEKIRAAGHVDIPIIALTANAMEHNGEKCILAGMNDYVPKPVKELDMHQALKKHIRKSLLGARRET